MKMEKNFMKQFNVSKHIDETGDINLQRCFHDAYGQYPLCCSPYVFQNDKELEEEYENGHVKFDYGAFKDEIVEKLKDKFEIKTINYRNKSGWNVKHIGFSKQDDVNIIFFYNNTFDFFVYYDETSEVEAMNLANNFFIDLVKKHINEKVFSTNTIYILTQTSSGFDLIPQEIHHTDMDVDECFEDDFKPIDKTINETIENNGSGLIILHGTQGTGKTTYIRKLINTHKKRFIMMNNNVMNSFTDPTFIQFLMKQKDSIIIVEDCEQLLRERGANTFNNGISSILNMTDGIYSDIINLKIIATFNANLKDIDPALLRKGRLIAKYEFNPLSVEKTNKILKRLGHPESNKGMTLADIFNYDDASYSKERNKIGFN